MVSAWVLASISALTIGEVGAFHVPVLPSTGALGEGRATAVNRHVSRMSGADDKAQSFYPFKRLNTPSTRCVVLLVADLFVEP